MDQATEQRAQIFSIPNLMSMFRIVLIPFFAAAVLQGRTIAAIALIAVSALTDVADGYVARRFHMVTQLGKVLDGLAERERKVIRLRFGLEDGHPRTLEEVGREFGVTRERIRQIESKTLAKLRHPSRSSKLKDYLED